MRYKVGDKMKVRSDLKENIRYGGQIFVRDMAVHCGKNVEISKVYNDAYCIKESDREWFWTDEMFEGLAEDELTAEEAIKVLADMCARECKNCELGKLVKESRYSFCSAYRREHPDKVVEILKQWKKDHEKKEVEVTQKIYCLVVDEEREVVHEEEIGNSDSCMDVLKNYCENHDGKFFSLMEFRYEVKQ